MRNRGERQIKANDLKQSGVGLNEAIGQLTMANSVHWYGHELRNEGGNVLRRDIKFRR